MPRERRSTSSIASLSLAYGHMRHPPNAGPSTVLWIAITALSPDAPSRQNTTCSCSRTAMRSKTEDMLTPALEGNDGLGSAKRTGILTFETGDLAESTQTPVAFSFH